jgi:hypothetical protein
MAQRRYQATYGELFSQHLEQLLARGGTPFVMREAVKAYDGDSETRRPEFEGWVHQTAAFSCIRCGRVFSPKKEIEETSYIECTWCK